MRRFFWIPFVLMLLTVLPVYGAINISLTVEQAEKGVPEGQLRLGKAYHYGTGVPRDYKKAFSIVGDIFRLFHITTAPIAIIINP